MKPLSGTILLLAVASIASLVFFRAFNNDTLPVVKQNFPSHSTIQKPPPESPSETVQVSWYKNRPLLHGDPNDTDVWCDNWEEMGDFKKPVPVVWTAKFTGCLVSCEGMHFTRLPESANYKYPRFSGYFKSKARLPDEFDQFALLGNLTLKIHGDWTGIDASYVDSVFGGKCSPVLDINEVEIVPSDR